MTSHSGIRRRSSSIIVWRWSLPFVLSSITITAAAAAAVVSADDLVRDARCLAKCYRQISSEKPKVCTHIFVYSSFFIQKYHVNRVVPLRGRLDSECWIPDGSGVKNIYGNTQSKIISNKKKKNKQQLVLIYVNSIIRSYVLLT